MKQLTWGKKLRIVPRIDSPHNTATLLQRSKYIRFHRIFAFLFPDQFEKF